MKDEIVEALFPGLANLIVDPNIQAVLTIDHKRRILQALDVTAEQLSDTHVRLSILMLNLDVDISDSSNPKINVSINLGSNVLKS